MPAESSRIMYVAVVILGLVAIASILTSFLSQNRSILGGSQYEIPVEATGTASAVPTQLQIGIQVNGTGPTAQSATENMSAALTALNATLYRYLGGNLSMVDTESYSMNPIYVTRLNTTMYLSCMGVIGNSSICYNQSAYKAEYYQAAESLQVTIPGIQGTGGLLLNVSGIQNVKISSVSASLSDAQIRQLASTALVAALANATAEARAVAGNGTQLYIGNITINSNVYTPYYYSYGTFSGAALIPSAGTIAPQYYVGMNKVTESISVRFYYPGLKV